MAKILLVCSENTLAEKYTKYLIESGFDVETELSAKDGLDRIGDEFFPAAVACLPREESLWFLIKVRALHRVSASSTPILVITDEKSDSLSEYFDSGATKALRAFDTTSDQLGESLKRILNIPRMRLSL
ncbi:MAG TPA: hypothetical protein VLE47_01425 [Candidatus Saccharimonadales bacterium]|nr:hypothetical protein [Candidatus Saccharimonadales bacterium]